MLSGRVSQEEIVVGIKGVLDIVSVDRILPTSTRVGHQQISMTLGGFLANSGEGSDLQMILNQ